MPPADQVRVQNFRLEEACDGETHMRDIMKQGAAVLNHDTGSITYDKVVSNMAEKCDLAQIRKNVEQSIGEKVQLKANKGRKKSFIKEGVLENSYASIFIVKFENDYEMTRRVSYSYTDILTKAVEIVRCRDNKSILVS